MKLIPSLHYTRRAGRLDGWREAELQREEELVEEQQNTGRQAGTEAEHSLALLLFCQYMPVDAERCRRREISYHYLPNNYFNIN
jgi:hypothetical protein